MDFVQRQKNQTAKNALYEAIVLLRKNLGDKDHGYDSSILLARLLVWTNELDECIEICDSIMSASTFDYLALHIRGIARLQTGDIIGALADLIPLNRINPLHGLLAWNLAISYFYNQQFSEAWHIFAVSNSIIPNTYQNVPYWAGENLNNKNIILTQYNSNGGGDDIMYAHLIPEIIEKTEKCFIETDQRTQSLYENSFGNGEVFLTGENPWKEKTQIDYQVMVPTIAGTLRRKVSDFDRPSGYLKPKESERRLWKNYTDTIAQKNLKVGICWRSMISIGLTGPMSTSIEDWGNVFKIPNISFFELQYDNSEEERLLAKELFDIDIHELKNVDLMKDFEKIAAITLSLDIVISAVTTISLIANSVGARVWELRPDYTALCMSGLPWFPNRKIYSRQYTETWGNVLNKLSADLRNHADKTYE